ncbi:hypothetical protein [Streptomyces sp. NPDC056690]|uniref:hypothetical protein n=1 Tax=unclassified Streptomyces TaxID=2593676 RepID=UPI003641321E
MINRLVIFGATGDLGARFLLPALVALRAAGDLDDRILLTGASREDWDGEQYREWVTLQIDRHGGHYPADAKAAVADAARYQRADVTNPADIASAIAVRVPSPSISPCPRPSFPS